MNALTLKAQKTILEEAGQPPPGLFLDRRTKERFVIEFELPMRIYWRDGSSRLHDGPGVIRNVSGEGLGVESECCLFVGQMVTVRTVALSLHCRVRHVKDSRRGFQVGLQMLPVSRAGLKSMEMLSAAVTALESCDAEQD